MESKRSGKPLFGSSFDVTNMNGRPVFIRMVGTIDGRKGFRRCGGGCINPASFCVYELNGNYWYWCGKCMSGV